MAREIPEVVRAFAGLAATVLDEARKLPETLPGLPVRVIGQVLQQSLKLQQQYSGLVARGDELFTGLRGADEPGMATFDDDLPAATPPASANRSSAFDRVDDSALQDADLDADLDAGSDPVFEQLADELADDMAVAGLPLAESDSLAGSDGLPEETAVVLALTVDDGDLSPAEVAALPDDPQADAITAVVDELATEVDAEIGAAAGADVPEEVLEELSADAVTEVAEDEAALEEAVVEAVLEEAAVEEAVEEAVALEEALEDEAALEEALEDEAALEEAVVEAVLEEAAVEEALEEAVALEEALEDAAVEEAVADELIADAAVGGAPPAELVDDAGTPDATTTDSAPTDSTPTDSTPSVPSLGDLTADPAPADTADGDGPAAAALEDAAEELVDLGGPEAAESVTPGSDVTDSAASAPLVAPEQDAPADAAPSDDDGPAAAALEDAAEELVDLGGPEAAESVTPGSDVTDSAASDPLVAPEQDAPADAAPSDDDGPAAAALEDAAEELVDLGGPEAAESVTPGSDVTDSAASDPLVVPVPDAPADAAGATSPVEGYDAFSIPALRGRLRSYPIETVADLLDYERATQARAPYVTLLQNRLEKLSADRG